ncbi:MAG: HD domain-containing phosphohydrolase [Candidatus Omnitrophota bacterium]
MSSFIDITKIKDEEKKRESLYRGIMEVFALKAEEVGNRETAGHIRRIAAYTQLIAEKLRETEAFKYYISDTYIKDLSYASMLHDVGKWRTPNEILLKPTDLTPAEWEIIKQHPLLGVEMLSPLLKEKGGDQYLKLVESVVLYHHERWDGSGYPQKLTKEKIPLSARIVALADVYDALTSSRSYRKSLSHEEAYNVISREKEKFDPRIWKVFEDNHEEFKKIREITQ